MQLAANAIRAGDEAVWVGRFVCRDLRHVSVLILPLEFYLLLLRTTVYL